MIMNIVLPNKVNGLNKIIENLESINQTNLKKCGHFGEVHVSLPKFKIISEHDFEKPLAMVRNNSIA